MLRVESLTNFTQIFSSFKKKYLSPSSKSIDRRRRDIQEEKKEGKDWMWKEEREQFEIINFFNQSLLSL